MPLPIFLVALMDCIIPHLKSMADDLVTKKLTNISVAHEIEIELFDKINAHV